MDGFGDGDYEANESEWEDSRVLKIDRAAGMLIVLPSMTFRDAELGERSGLQELLLKSDQAFFGSECQEKLFLIKEEVEPCSEVASRIDLLAVDAMGRAVVIELKRGRDKLQLLQSLTYAAMISDWSEDDFEQRIPAAKSLPYQRFKADHEITKVNEYQRVILIAEDYDFEILKTAEWLTNFYGLDITCYQISLAKVNREQEYLAVVQLFPPRPLASKARRLGALKSKEASKFPELEGLLESCTNTTIKDFFTQHLEDRRNRRRDSLVFPQTGRMRFRERRMKPSPKLNWRRKLSPSSISGG